MIFFDVTLKFRYKPIISNDFIYKITRNKTGKLTVCVSFLSGE